MTGSFVGGSKTSCDFCKISSRAMLFHLFQIPCVEAKLNRGIVRHGHQLDFKPRSAGIAKGVMKTVSAGRYVHPDRTGAIIAG
jgi:hypothetical protein